MMIFIYVSFYLLYVTGITGINQTSYFNMCVGRNEPHEHRSFKTAYRRTSLCSVARKILIGFIQQEVC